MTDARKRGIEDLKKSLSTVELPEATRRVSTGIISVDLATGGGFPEGRFSEVAGEWQTGKSLICYQAIAQCQKSGGLAILDDAERAFDKRWAKILGINTDELMYFISTSLEHGFEHVEMVAKQVRENEEFKDKSILYVKDSLEASIAKEEAEQDFAKAGIAQRARVISRCLRRITNLIADQRIAVVFVNQLRTNVGVMFGPNEESGGGKAPKFYAGLRCIIKKHGKIIEESRVVGTKGILEVIKSKVGVPFKRTEFEINFNKGIDRYSGLLPYLVAEGVITRPTTQSYGFGDLRFKAKEFRQVWKENSKDFRKALSGVNPIRTDKENKDNEEETTETERPSSGKIRKKIS
jgi:recombination protein RecA